KPKKRSSAAPRRQTKAAPAKVSFTLAEVAQVVGGRVVGTRDLRLKGTESLERAGPEEISWIADSKRAEEAERSRAGAVLVSNEGDARGRPCVVVANATVALAIWLAYRHPSRRPPRGISRSAHVDPRARLGKDVSIAAGATIEAGARVGAGTVIGAGAFVGA